MPAGRPRDEVKNRLKKGWQDRMKDLAREGASDVEVRGDIGISIDLWYRWIADEPEFAETIKECKMLCQTWWERTGRNMAKGAEGNSAVWIFNMKNRFGWKDKQEIEHSGGLAIVKVNELDEKI